MNVSRNDILRYIPMDLVLKRISFAFNNQACIVQLEPSTALEKQIHLSIWRGRGRGWKECNYP
jgi:hypothetical protein